MSLGVQKETPQWQYDGKLFPQTHHIFDKAMDFGDVSEASVDAKGTTEYANRAIALGISLALGLLGFEGLLMSQGVKIPDPVPLITTFTSMALPWIGAAIGEKRSGVTDYIKTTLRRSQPEEPTKK
ncbi:MAG TPA: hypothetical protein VF189_02040 [Patescibacteria group bacterium]